MSDPHTTHGKTAAEEDEVPTGRLVVIGAGALAIFFVASVIATLILNQQRSQVWPHGPPPAPEQAGQRAINLVEQVQFENQTVVQETVNAAQQQLRSYGWVDRPGRQIHLPIERAMELVAQGVRP